MGTLTEECEQVGGGMIHLHGEMTHRAEMTQDLEATAEEVEVMAEVTPEVAEVTPEAAIEMSEATAALTAEVTAETLVVTAETAEPATTGVATEMTSEPTSEASRQGTVMTIHGDLHAMRADPQPPGPLTVHPMIVGHPVALTLPPNEAARLLPDSTSSLSSSKRSRSRSPSPASKKPNTSSASSSTPASSSSATDTSKAPDAPKQSNAELMMNKLKALYAGGSATTAARPSLSNVEFALRPDRTNLKYMQLLKRDP
jgi:hypothetical protein